MAAGGDDWSYSFWYYLDLPNNTAGAHNLFTDYNVGLFSNTLKRDDGGNLIEITRTDDGSVNGSVDGTIQSGQGSNNQVWVNVIQVSDYDSGADATTVSQYINGTLGTSFPKVKGGSPVGGDVLYIGSDNSLLVGNTWEGYIDDFAVYDHALTSGEIAALQTASVVSGPPPVLTEVEWDEVGGGDWNDLGNWSPLTVPNATTITAVFGQKIQQSSTVFTDLDVTVKGVEFLNSNTYVVSGSGSIHLNSGTSAPRVLREKFAHKILKYLSQLSPHLVTITRNL